jgi:hypothetical protein
MPIGLVRDDAEACRGEEILRDGAPEIPDGLIVECFSRSMNGSGSRPSQLAQRAQELRGEFNADRRLQVGLAQHLAQAAAELAIHADVDVRIHQVAHLGQVAAQRHHHVDLAADAFDQAADFVQGPRAC